MFNGSHTIHFHFFLKRKHFIFNVDFKTVYLKKKIIRFKLNINRTGKVIEFNYKLLY